MTRSPEPRLLRADEFEELMALLDRSFSYERGGMAARLPYVYDPDRPERHAVITVDDTIVSHVACVPEPLELGEGTTVPCVGIGGVATAKPHRGNGYMTRLLTFWLEWMDEHGIQLAELGGDRTRYGRFGWEPAGQRIVYTLTERSMGTLPGDEDVTRYVEDEEELAAVRRLHRHLAPRFGRDESTAATIYGQRGMETLLYRDGGEPTAYVCLSRERRDRTVKEFGGDPDGIEAILGWCLSHWDVDRFTISAHPADPHNEQFAELASGWQTRPARLLNVRDLPALLETYEGPLGTTWRNAGQERSGELTLGIEGAARCARVQYEPGSLSIRGAEVTPDLALDRRAATRLLFGGPGRMRSTKERYPILDVLFPLGIRVWGSERV